MTIKYQTKKHLEKPKHTIKKKHNSQRLFGEGHPPPIVVVGRRGGLQGAGFWGRPAHLIVSENTLANLSIWFTLGKTHDHSHIIEEKCCLQLQCAFCQPVLCGTKK